MTSDLWFDVATRPAILDRVGALLGDDVLLCGANLVERIPGQVHPWHVDTHLADPAGMAVSVWIGMRNVGAGSTLRVVPGSHRYGFTPEEQAANEDRDACNVNDDDALRWAREADADATLLTIPTGPGDAIFIDGAMWHATNNEASTDRVAVVLHYATPEKPVRLHAPVKRYPYRFLDEPRPPCQIVHGSDRCGVNRLVPAPGRGTERLGAVFETQPVYAEATPSWKPDPLFVGSTRALSFLSVKAHKVHPARIGHGLHAHAEEQITISFDDGASIGIGHSRPLDATFDAGGFVYIPPGTMHTAQNRESDAQRQVDIVWLGARRGAQVPVGFGVGSVHDAEPDSNALIERGRSAVELVAGPTATLDRLRVLRVDMRPGFVGRDDTDAYDAVVVVLRGRIATLDRTAAAGDVVLYAAGETHSISVVGDEDVLLLVVELKSIYKGRPVRSLRRAVTSRLPRRVRMAIRRARAALRR